MCTVSIVPTVDGVRVMSNRDERRDRAAALDPRIDRLGCRTAMLPIDPEGGGSWIGVNDTGLVAALLNLYDGQPVRARLPATVSSRGAIVRLALSCDSIGAALDAVLALDPAAFQPFRLVLVHDGTIAMAAGNSREIAHAEAALDGPWLFTASSLGDKLVDAPRRRLFETVMAPAVDRLRAQQLFHRHQWPDQREVSVLLESEAAVTVSRTIVDVDHRSLTLEYESLLPRRPAARVELPRC